jgi:flagellar protein FliT
MASIRTMPSQLELYEQMAKLSGRMATAAQANDWDELIELEQRVAALREALMMSEEGNPSPEEAIQKRVLIQRILDDDAEVRRHTEPWMEQVRRFLGAGNQQRRVERAYGAAS